MKGARIDDRISFLRGIERDWEDWSAGKNTKPHWLFLVGGLTATGMLIFLVTQSEAYRGFHCCWNSFSSRRIVTGM